MITKICLKCKIEKPLSEFWKNKNTKDGFQVRCKQYNKEYRIKKKDILKIKSIIYAKKRRKENIQVRLKDSLSSRLRLALKGLCKSSSTMILIGCEIDYLMYYIQERFTKGMSWDNYGDWHIDHIKPCAKFDLSKESEQRACFHYTNLQPLWAEDNLRKGSKYGKS